MSTADQLASALEAARNGIEWWRDMYPADANGSDDEMLSQIDEALAAYRQSTTPAKAPGAALLEAVDSMLDTAPCECGDRRRFDKGEHLSGCYLFDINIARTSMATAQAPAQRDKL